jgi:hypothetical protein
MEFKGHNNLRISTFDSGKLIISSNGKDEKFISDEYQYKNYKLTKHIDFINWRISYHTYNKNNERIELRTYSFEENPKNAELEGYKKFEYENGKLINENHFIITGKEEKLEYEGKFTYLGKELVREDFHYPNEIYTMHFKFDEKKNILTKVFPNKDGYCEYHYDENGFLKKFINFKENNYCQINEYQYQNNRLHKLIEYPILKFKKSLFSNKTKLLEKGQFINESEFFYDNNEVLVKEVKTDILNDYGIETLQYEYENNVG